MSTRRLALLIVISLTCGPLAIAQDSQSVADAARQSRQKQQQGQAQAGSSTGANQPADPGTKPPAKAAHVYTNDEIPEHTGPDLPSAPQRSSDLAPTNYKGGKQPAQVWKSQILRMKNSIASLQKQIDSLQSSIRFAGGNYEKHVLYNDRQRQKEQQVENLKSQLSQQQKALEDMQEEARHQGYSSAVYDP
ncbi:MAG TPA: hypothetical protein VKQ11_09745 [Candidatus Sulfotelmatobacter sp.]|nr:hypothetical protein [Candidatus Sulfotelmatobacter sp.]